MTPHVKGGEKDEFDNCGTDFHYMFGQVDTWESVTNSNWLMYDTSGASVRRRHDIPEPEERCAQRYARNDPRALWATAI